jgi:hypothetical protein
MTGATVIARVEKNSREEIIIALDEFKSIDLLDIRVFASFGDDETRKPTKKGIAVKVEKIPALITALQDAEAEAKRRGLI